MTRMTFQVTTLYSPRRHEFWIERQRVSAWRFLLTALGTRDTWMLRCWLQALTHVGQTEIPD